MRPFAGGPHCRSVPHMLFPAKDVKNGWQFILKIEAFCRGGTLQVSPTYALPGKGVQKTAGNLYRKVRPFAGGHIAGQSHICFTRQRGSKTAGNLYRKVRPSAGGHIAGQSHICLTRQRGSNTAGNLNRKVRPFAGGHIAGQSHICFTRQRGSKTAGNLYRKVRPYAGDHLAGQSHIYFARYKGWASMKVFSVVYLVP